MRPSLFFAVETTGPAVPEASVFGVSSRKIIAASVARTTRAGNSRVAVVTAGAPPNW
jgi:hypothetical protein